MDVQALKHAAKMTEWCERVHACRTSGLPVRTWCEQNSVNTKTYYKWERLYLTEVSRQMVAQAQLPEPTSGQLVRIDPEQLPDEVSSYAPEVPVQTISKVDITLRHGNTSVDMPAGMDISQIAALVKALG